MTPTEQDNELPKSIEKILRFNCPSGCDGNGSYPEMSSDGDWEQGQCQWCFEYGMPAREAIKKHELDVQINELSLVYETNDHIKFIERRIAQLQAELEEKK